jgi:hypothetical protein
MIERRLFSIAATLAAPWRVATAQKYPETGSLILGSLQALQDRSGLCGLVNPAILLVRLLREKVTLDR